MSNKTSINPALDISLFSLPLSTKEIFGNRNKSALEIGFGEGEFIVELARNNPGWNYLGIEIKYFRYRKAVKLAANENIKNVRLLHIDADLAVEQAFTGNSFDKIYINFPDPWPKDRHKKHRIINNTFLNNLYTVMKDGSVIEFTSDHLDYINHTIEHFDKYKKFSNIYGSAGYSETLQNRPRTKFEIEYLEKKRQIYYLAFKKLL